MKDIMIGTFLVILLGYFANQVADWWIIVVIAGLVGVVLQKSPSKSFLFGFLGGAILYGVVAYWLDAQNGGILSTRMAEILGGISPLLITILLGGILSGLGAMTGSFLSALRNKNQPS